MLEKEGDSDTNLDGEGMVGAIKMLQYIIEVGVVGVCRNLIGGNHLSRVTLRIWFGDRHKEYT